VIGRAYLEKSRPVTVLVRWWPGSGDPRNVLARCADGTILVRLFRAVRCGCMRGRWDRAGESNLLVLLAWNRSMGLSSMRHGTGTRNALPARATR
jgi:hypothetical protein